MVVDALTKRHGNSVTMLLLRDGVLSFVDEDQELAMREKRTMKRTNVICDHIDKWSKRNPWNGTDETQWAVLTRSKQVRFLALILEQSFPVDEARCTSAFFSEHVVSLCLSSSSDEHHRSHSCLGTGMRVGIQNKFCHHRASLDNRIRDMFGLCVFASATLLICLFGEAVAVSLY